MPNIYQITNSHQFAIGSFPFLFNKPKSNYLQEELFDSINGMHLLIFCYI
jgi:hypothetical protein